MPRILLIDDDAVLRGVLATSLACAGHAVVQASDGPKGVKLLRAGPADLVITDLVNPNHEGIELIQELRRGWPGLPIVVTCGGSRASLYLGLAGKLGARLTLEKPFTPAALLRAVEEILGPRPQPPSAR